MTVKGAERWAEKIVSKYFPGLSYHTPFLGLYCSQPTNEKTSSCEIALPLRKNLTFCFTRSSCRFRYTHLSSCAVIALPCFPFLFAISLIASTKLSTTKITDYSLNRVWNSRPALLVFIQHSSLDKSEYLSSVILYFWVWCRLVTCIWQCDWLGSNFHTLIQYIYQYKNIFITFILMQSKLKI